MREIILDIPLEKNSNDKLFEYVSFQKGRKAKSYFTQKLGYTFQVNIEISKPLLHSSSNKKQVVIKNIGNMTKAHLKNALSYTIRNSDNKLAINHLGEEIKLKEIMQDWQKDFSSNEENNEALHLVFSLNELKSDSILEILKNATRDTLQANFAEYKWVMIPHLHQNQPHIHILLNKTNIFTHKKLNFKGRSIADFFETLREDFRYNLFIYSRGKLDYTNEVSSKGFRAQLLQEKIQTLDSMQIGNSLDKNIDFFAHYKQALYSVSSKRKRIFLDNEHLTKELNNTQIYLYNVKKKIDSIMLEGKTPSNLLTKKDVLESTIKDLQTKIQSNVQKMQELDTHIKHFLNWQEEFHNFSKNFDDFNKKKAFIKSMQGFERYIPCDLAHKLINIKQEVADKEKLLNTKSNDVMLDILTNIPKDNAKYTSYTLKRNIKALQSYKGVLHTLTFDDTRASSNKTNSLALLEQNEAQLKALLLQRFQFLCRHITSCQDSLRQYLSLHTISSLGFIESIDKDTKALQEYKDFLRLYKKIGFLEKEFVFCYKALQGYNMQISHNNTPKEMLDTQIIKEANTLKDTLAQNNSNSSKDLQYKDSSNSTIKQIRLDSSSYKKQNSQK